MTYKVKTEVYEGPFDLLLDLILRKKLNIYEISLAQITADYLDYLQRMGEFDLEFTSEFLLVAATLLDIKARGLLSEEEEDTAFPQTTEELASKLMEYKKFKNTANFLKKRLEYESNFFAGESFLEERFSPSPSDFFKGLSLKDLAQVLITLLVKNRLAEYSLPISAPLKIAEKMDFILKKLRYKRQTLSVLMEGDDNKGDLIATFLALLELYKRGKIFLDQPQTFGEIEVALKSSVRH